MKNIKLLFGFLFITLFATSCYTEVMIGDDYIDEPVLYVNQVINSSELWYVDINATIGNGEVPFLQRAFTISFDDFGTMYANNNIVGLGKTGYGYGISVATYAGNNGILEINHDVYGYWELEVYVTNNSTIELYHRNSDTSYFLRGYQISNFDYDMLFYDNIQYFLQEYTAWEKVYTSQEGVLNDFDSENFIQFLASDDRDFFRSSVDQTGTSISNLQWNFQGNYQVYDVTNDSSLKTITLSYDFFGDDYFELYVLNDSRIELYHPSSGTTYEFKGKGYIQYLKSESNTTDKKRVKTSNSIMNVTRQKTS